MTRRMARITHDEVTRMVKAIRDLGLPIGRVEFDGSSISVVIAVDNVEKPVPAGGHEGKIVPLLREPKL